MYREVVEALTKQQIDELEKRGIVRSTVSAWKHGKRSPTLPQAKVLAIVAMVSFSDLVEELAELEATPEQRSFFRATVAKGLAASFALFFCILQVLFAEDAKAAEPALARVSGLSSQAETQPAHCTLW